MRDKFWNLQSNELLAFNALELLTGIAAIWLHCKFAAAWVHQMPLNSELLKSLGEHLHSTCGQKSQRKRHAKCDHNSRCLSQYQKRARRIVFKLSFLFICLLCNSETYIFPLCSVLFVLVAWIAANRVVNVRFHFFAYADGEPTLAAHHSWSGWMWRSVFCMCRAQYLCVRHFSIVLFLCNFFAFSRLTISWLRRNV